MHLKGALRKHFSQNIYDIEIQPRELLSLEIESLLSSIHFLFPQPQRDLCVFCIGLPRSGTHSLAYMFRKYYKAAHEPRKRETIINILRWESKQYSRAKMLRILALRDKRLQLNVEASHHLHHVVDLLVELFPKAKFILTVREPISWLASETNQNYRTRKIPAWRSLERYRYGRYHCSYQHPDLENIANVYPIESYLSYWKDHIAKVLDYVPSEKLLMIDTFEIKQKLNEIALFVGIDPKSLDADRQWSGKRTSEIELYDLVNKCKIHEQVKASCSDFIKENLPFLAKYHSA